MTELEQLCENALYDEIRVLEDGKSVVRDIPTGKLYFKKKLDVYNEKVYEYLRAHKNRNVAAVQAYWKDADQLVVIEELIQGRTLDEMLAADEALGASPGQKTAESPGAPPAATPGEAPGMAPIASARAAAPALPFSERIDILAQICDGLEFLHSAQPPIIHRDIKASNIMVTDDFVVKIIDYDAAKIFITGQDKDTMMIGTQGLAAPEQYGFAQSDVRTDLYALGKLIERMLPENVDAKRIVDKATKMDPKKRYTSAAQMKAQILRIREKPSALDQKFEKIPGFDPMNKAHRIRARVGLAAAVLAVIAIGAALGWWLVVYPAKQAEQIRTELVAIEELDGKNGKIARAVQAFAESHPYQKMNEEQKKSVREGMVEALAKCYIDAGEEEAEKVRSILAEKYGEEAVWEAVLRYAKAEFQFSKNSHENALQTLQQCREDGAIDADEYWDKAGARLQASAKANMEKFRKNAFPENLNDVVSTHALMIKYGAESEEEFQAAYQEIMDEARGYRESQHYDMVVIIYETLQKAGMGDQEELNRLIAETRYDKAEAAFAEESYTEAAKTYAALGDYRDSAEKFKKARYCEGVHELEKKSYANAVEAFAEIPGYKDADELALESKYRYCEMTREKPITATYTYLEDLVDSGYEGADELWDEICKWWVSIETGLAYSIGSMQGAYVKATLDGGPPDGSTTVTFRVDNANWADSDTWCDGEKYKKGDVVKVDYTKDDSSFDLFEQTYKVWVYADGGELIGTWEGKFDEN